jgi:hypothetical protein
MALSLFFVIYLRVSFFISEQCITLEKKMAKTKRRSCKGRRRSLKRGGVPFKDTVSNFANRTASTARRVKDSVFGLPSALRNSKIGATALNAIGLRSDYIDHSKLAPVKKTIQKNYGPIENAADKVYAVDERGYLYEAALDNLTPDGYLPDLSNPRKARFYPGRGPKPGQSWYITHRKRFH